MNPFIFVCSGHIQSIFFSFSRLKKVHSDAVEKSVSEDILFLLKPGGGIFAEAIVLGFKKVGGANEHHRLVTADVLDKVG